MYAIAILVAAGAAAAIGQTAGVIAWEYHDTEHFEVVYPKGLAANVEELGRDFEAVYARISADLGHELPFTPMVAVFATRAELDRATRGGLLPPSREHITVALDSSRERMRGSLAHDLSHTFLFDMLPRPLVNDLPLWFTEGLAEHEQGEWIEADLAAIQALTVASALPRVSTLAPLALPEDPVLNRALGHALFDFIASRWQKQGLQAYLEGLRDRVSREQAYSKAFGLTAAEFDAAFHQYLRTRAR